MYFTSKFFQELTLQELYESLKTRSEIFMIEQNILCVDMDDVDYDALHCFFVDEGRVVAYLRAYDQDKENGVVQIGRTVTLIHGNGLGRALMENSIPVIKEKMNCKKLCMNAQKHAVGFYEKFGFRVTSGDFLEEGVVHQKMELTF